MAADQEPVASLPDRVQVAADDRPRASARGTVRSLGQIGTDGDHESRDDEKRNHDPTSARREAEFAIAAGGGHASPVL